MAPWEVRVGAPSRSSALQEALGFLEVASYAVVRTLVEGWMSLAVLCALRGQSLLPAPGDEAVVGWKMAKPPAAPRSCPCALRAVELGSDSAGALAEETSEQCVWKERRRLSTA